jgi:protein TonB
MRVVEALVFVSLATGAHIGVWAVTPAVMGARAVGVASTDTMTLASATPAQAAMAVAWSRPPETTSATPVALVAPENTSTPKITYKEPIVTRTAQPSYLRAPISSDAVAMPDKMPLPVLPNPDIPLQTATLAAPVTDTSPRPSPEQDQVARSASPQALKQPAPDTKIALPSPSEPLQNQTRPQPRPDRAAAAAPRQGTSAPKASATAGAAGNAQSSARDATATHALLSSWGAQIHAKIQRNVIYPKGANDVGIAKISLSVRTDGTLVDMSVVRSSGSDALDKAALRAITRAKRFAKAPRGLDAPSYALTVQVSFTY